MRFWDFAGRMVFVVLMGLLLYAAVHGSALVCGGGDSIVISALRRRCLHFEVVVG